MKISASRITQRQVKNILHYQPDSGVFTWKMVCGRRAPIGGVAGCIGTQGYRIIGIQGTRYKAASLAWLYIYGEWPEYCIDHINGNKADDRLSNLRKASRSENLFNRGVFSNSLSGIKGVGLFRGKWKACCYSNGKRKWLGFFPSKEEAVKAYRDYAEKEHGIFFHD